VGCGCGKKKQQSLVQASSSYVLTMPDGQTSEHPSRLDAEVQNIRAGGGGKVARPR